MVSGIWASRCKGNLGNFWKNTQMACPNGQPIWVSEQHFTQKGVHGAQMDDDLGMLQI